MSDLVSAYRLPATPDPAGVMIDLVLGMIDRPRLAERSVNVDLPSRLESAVPFVLIHHWDGDSDRFGIRAVVDVSVFASLYRDARNLALEIEAKLLGYPHRVSSGGRSVLVDMVEVATGTREVEWQRDSTVRRFQATYTFSIRR